jgi:hypothetical protein
MTTAEQITVNRQALSAQLRAQLNLPALASDWSYSQRVDYNKAFAAYVLAHPESFGVMDQQTAQIVTAEKPQDLSDTSMSANIQAFGSELLDNALEAGSKVAGIGQGVLDTAAIAKWLIPLGAVLVVGILLYGFYKRETAK